jgi:hypothetical protein
MTDLQSLRARYLKDPLTTQLGGLAANLARIKSFSNNPQHKEIVRIMIIESEYFSEWAGLKAHLNVQIKLVELQQILARWLYNWNDIWEDKEILCSVIKQADMWTRDILCLAGYDIDPVSTHHHT